MADLLVADPAVVPPKTVINGSVVAPGSLISSQEAAVLVANHHRVARVSAACKVLGANRNSGSEPQLLQRDYHRAAVKTICRWQQPLNSVSRAALLPAWQLEAASSLVDAAIVGSLNLPVWNWWDMLCLRGLLP